MLNLTGRIGGDSGLSPRGTEVGMFNNKYLVIGAVGFASYLHINSIGNLHVIEPFQSYIFTFNCIVTIGYLHLLRSIMGIVCILFQMGGWEDISCDLKKTLSDKKAIKVYKWPASEFVICNPFPLLLDIHSPKILSYKHQISILCDVAIFHLFPIRPVKNKMSLSSLYAS